MLAWASGRGNAGTPHAGSVHSLYVGESWLLESWLVQYRTTPAELSNWAHPWPTNYITTKSIYKIVCCLCFIPYLYQFTIHPTTYRKLQYSCNDQPKPHCTLGSLMWLQVSSLVLCTSSTCACIVALCMWFWPYCAALQEY